MARFKFSRDHNHRWPSGAETAFKKDWSGTVKREVAEAAKAAGAGTWLDEPTDDAPTPAKRKAASKPRGRPRRAPATPPPAEPATGERLPGNLPPDLAEPDALTPNRHLADGNETQ